MITLQLLHAAVVNPSLFFFLRREEKPAHKFEVHSKLVQCTLSKINFPSKYCLLIMSMTSDHTYSQTNQCIPSNWSTSHHMPCARFTVPCMPTRLSSPGTHHQALLVNSSGCLVHMVMHRRDSARCRRTQSVDLQSYRMLTAISNGGGIERVRDEGSGLSNFNTSGN